ncbi:hypothetical protein F5146DRAFT_1000904 [Armillaria mellea]|nr:hypothetical protein F5146DRAFT_1000904 [Armillaria mellea]
MEITIAMQNRFKNELAAHPEGAFVVIVVLLGDSRGPCNDPEMSGNVCRSEAGFGAGDTLLAHRITDLMEKYSAYRDPGTGIQWRLRAQVETFWRRSSFPSDTLLEPFESSFSSARSRPISDIGGRNMLHLQTCCAFTPYFGTTVYSIVIAHSAFERRNFLDTRGMYQKEAGFTEGKIKSPTNGIRNPGDVIVSNWVSWIEILWLAFRFNPVFVLPVPASSALTSAPSKPSDPVSRTPGRRTGTGSANVSVSTRAPRERIPIIGFQRLSLLNVLRQCGYVPPYRVGQGLAPQSFEAIRSTSDRPIVVFPECTTSNGRGLIRFCDVFNQNIPVQGWQVFVMCVRYDPPTILSSTLSHSIPARSVNPLSQVFNVATSITPPSVSIRLLAPSESPSSPTFLASDVLIGSYNDQLSEACAVLIAQLGKMKRTRMGWEDKANFLEFYWGRRSS